LERRLAILIGSALLVQIFVRYWGQGEETLHWGNVFWATAAARLLVPLAVAYALGLSLRQLGFTKPRIGGTEALVLLGLVGVATLIALPLLGMNSYQAWYQGIGAGARSFELWRSWIEFTLSTTVPWELFFRGFMLFGLREILRAGGRGGADTIALLITASFEVLYHLIKPPQEAIGLLVGSPILSYVAFRHGSVWIPLLGHLWIEFLWFMAVWR
jgi:hypothetical protein